MNWLQKIIVSWKKYLLLFFIGIIVLLLVVHVLFKMKLGVYWLEAEWDAGDVLSFIGTILSFLGTVFLGCITVKLSQDNNDINMRLVAIEAKRDTLEKDKRLGYIVVDKMQIKYRRHIEKISNSRTIPYEISDLNCIDVTEGIHFRLKMIMSSESTINKLIRNSVKVYKLDFHDDYQNMTSTLCWFPIYKREEEYTRNVNPLEKSFDDIIIMAECDREPQGFYELREIMVQKLDYMIELSYSYNNTLQESRREVLQITCRGNEIIKSEIVSIE